LGTFNAGIRDIVKKATGQYWILGEFTTINGGAFPYIALYTMATDTFSTVGTYPGGAIRSGVLASDGNLYVLTPSVSPWLVWKWTGTAWSSLGTTNYAYFNPIAMSYNDDGVIGFRPVVGGGGVSQAASYWAGTWYAMGGGSGTMTEHFAHPTVNNTGQKMYVVGQDAAIPVPERRVYQCLWTGIASAWNDIGPGSSIVRVTQAVGQPIWASKIASPSPRMCRWDEGAGVWTDLLNGFSYVSKCLRLASANHLIVAGRSGSEVGMYDIAADAFIDCGYPYSLPYSLSTDYVFSGDA
jgi:hypothetical protein